MGDIKQMVGWFSSNKLRLFCAAMVLCLGFLYVAPVHAQTPTPTPTPETANPDDTVVCETKSSIAWLLCPVINAANEGVATLYGFIIDRLQFGLLESVEDDQNGKSGLSQTNWDNLRKSWGTVTKLATALLVAVLLLIIAGQSMEGFNFIDAYTAKKMLPKLIFALVLVNASWYITAFAIEVGNIVGGGVRDLIITPFKAGDLGSASIVADPGNAGSAILLALLTAGLLAFVVGPGVLAVAPILIGVGLAVLIGMVFVVLRQGLLMILIVAAPLAFVAQILPGTQKWFNYWQNALTGAIFIYPAFAAVVAIGAVLAIITGANANPDPNNPTALGVFNFAIAVFCYFAPFFGLPYLAKVSGGIVGKFAGIANDRGKGAIDRTRNWQRERRALAPSQIAKQQAKQEKARSAQMRAIGLNSGSGVGGRVRRWRASPTFVPGLGRVGRAADSGNRLARVANAATLGAATATSRAAERREAMTATGMATQEAEISKQLQGMNLEHANEFLATGGNTQQAVQSMNQKRVQQGKAPLNRQEQRQVGSSFQQMSSMGYGNNPAFAGAVAATAGAKGKLDARAINAGGAIYQNTPGGASQWQAKVGAARKDASQAGQFLAPSDATNFTGGFAGVQAESMGNYMQHLTGGQRLQPTRTQETAIEPSTGRSYTRTVDTFGPQGEELAQRLAAVGPDQLSGDQRTAINAQLDTYVGQGGTQERSLFEARVNSYRGPRGNA